MTQEHTTFVAKTLLDEPIRTFASRELAMAWWDDGREGACRFPGCYIAVETEVTTVRVRVIRRDRSHLGAAA